MNGSRTRRRIGVSDECESRQPLSDMVDVHRNATVSDYNAIFGRTYMLPYWPNRIPMSFADASSGKLPSALEWFEGKWRAH